ncbi:AraC family transcriptional regulator ligand-binding domain-containing protein [Variovorax sp. YR752]|uniref:AraC family transcriptional regulator n=1 Tax=Variovorax sp. YR752 TaxID=1884383 RepID=UPI003137C2FB
MVAYYDAATPLIPAQHQPAVLLEHLRSLDVDPGPLLAGAGLPTFGFDRPDAHCAPTQLLALLRSAAQALRDPELAFQLGRDLLPGHYGAASHALLTAGTLRRALHVMSTHGARLSPLLVPHVAVEGRLAMLYWTDACASAGMRAFLVDMQMSAVAAACHWLAGERLPWQYLFNRGGPRQRDAHEVHLGTDLHFNCHLDAMVIDAGWLDHPWANPRTLRSPAIAEALDREAAAQEPRRHLLALVYAHLLERVRCAPGLEDTAAAFAMSAATFKRRLAACGTHFQAELDQVRLHTALRLMHGHGLDNEAIGRYLGFEDPANFRRSMKRWAGLTPAQLRLRLGGLPGDGGVFA